MKEQKWYHYKIVWLDGSTYSDRDILNEDTDPSAWRIQTMELDDTIDYISIWDDDGNSY